jgi:hypothetical protein
MNTSYLLNKKIEKININLNENKDIVYQNIDSYGKCRCVQFNFEDKKVYMLTSPIPPLQIEEKNIDIYPININLALRFCEFMNINIVSQSVKDRVCKELNGTLGNINVIIPVEDCVILEDYKSTDKINFSENIVSNMAIYNTNKKFARYITEYTFWIFSKYIRENNIGEITDSILSKFCKEKMTVINGYPYGNIGKNFVVDSKIFHGAKLISSSREMLIRLMYVLKLYSIRDIKTLREYYSKNSIVNYYVDITDFDKHPSQVILQGDDVLYKLLHENKFSYIVEKKVITGISTPYFFSNKLIEHGEILLAQNAKNLSSAINIALTWQNKGYNPGDDVENKKRKVSFTLYSYKNENSIKRYEIDGEQQIEKIKIIGYKINNDPFFTCLLTI